MEGEKKARRAQDSKGKFKGFLFFIPFCSWNSEKRGLCLCSCTALLLVPALLFLVDPNCNDFFLVLLRKK